MIQASNKLSLPIEIGSRRLNATTLAKRFPDATILDVTSRGAEPWVRFSPFYPHGAIPVPFSPGLEAASVEGIWQALKVFEKCDVDLKKLSVTSMKGIKRTSRTYGKVLGHRQGVAGEQLLFYLEARKQIYLPSYLWVLENCLTEQIEELRSLASKAPLVLLDYEINCDLSNLSRPLSHAGLIKRFLENDWPEGMNSLDSILPFLTSRSPF
jgi:hypothetical protein